MVADLQTPPGVTPAKLYLELARRLADVAAADARHAEELLADALVHAEQARERLHVAADHLEAACRAVVAAETAGTECP